MDVLKEICAVLGLKCTPEGDRWVVTADSPAGPPGMMSSAADGMEYGSMAGGAGMAPGGMPDGSTGMMPWSEFWSTYFSSQAAAGRPLAVLLELKEADDAPAGTPGGAPAAALSQVSLAASPPADRELLEAKVREADAKLQEAEIKLKAAERRLKTARAKYEAGQATVDEVEDQRDAVELAKAELVRLKAEGDTLRLLLQRASRTSGLSAAAARSACLVNLKALALAVMLWATDHNETLPPADKWCDELQPYMAEAKASLLCPGDAPKLAELVCGYSYSLAIASKRLADIVDPAGTVMFYESTLNKLNAADNGESEPKPGRHDGGNNRAYVDCHAQWVARE